MPALVAGIHVFLSISKAWMAGTSPAMTTEMTICTARTVLLALLACVGAQVTCAQEAADLASYPARAIHIIVPFPPGGPADIIARVVGQRMSEDWGQPVVIDNRAGGNTTIGAVAAARAAPDGYTLF